MDASAILAMVHGELGEDVVRRSLAGSLISAVNVAEIGARLADHGIGEATLRETIAATGLEIVPFDAELAFATSKLRASTHSLGLSLGDRACIALAQRRKLPAMTADAAWARINVGVAVELIRKRSSR
jgi:PIN domain nuclease of toxin-antitoxin system